MEDTPAHSPGGSLDKGGPFSIPGSPLGEGSLMPISGASPGVSTGLIAPDPEQVKVLVAVVRPPSHEVDWRKPIGEYLQLGMKPNDKTKTWCLARRAKGYLIHANELYRHITLGILHWCIPPDVGKALLFDIHEGICEHHTSSRSMIEKAFRHGFY
jgi:hypothetical protein